MLRSDEILYRAPTLDDLHAVVALVNACSVAEGGSPDEMPEQWRAEWESSDLNLATDAWVAVAPDGRVAGYEQVEVSDDAAPMHLDGYVLPEFAGRGIGTRLLRLAEARARWALAMAEAGTCALLRGNIAAANDGARQLFEGEGYRVTRHFWRMEIELAQPPAPPAWPDGIAVSSFKPGQDERATYATVEAAFADHWEHTAPRFDEWKRMLMHRDDFDPTLWFLARAGEEVVGTALCYPRGDHFGWVRGLGVLRPWRGRGLGMALLRHALGAFHARGYHGAGLSVDAQSLTGATRLYERAGMRVTERYDLFEKSITT